MDAEDSDCLKRRNEDASLDMDTRVAFYRHSLGEREVQAIRDVLAGPILTTGEAVERFESSFAAYLGVDHALAVTSCTGALHMSLLALGIGPGDEVITTPMTFVATATAVLEAGATPVFVDVEERTGNIDAGVVEGAITSRTKAIIPVHLYGQMCDMKALRTIADRHGLSIVEDAAHCIEGSRDGIRPGQVSETACFSFYATKNITCGEGGAVVTRHRDLYDKLRLLRLHGMTKTAYDRHREGYRHWDMTVMGWKYNMDNIHAAMLIPQLMVIENTHDERERLAKAYDERLSALVSVRRPIVIEGSRHGRHLYTVWVEGTARDRIIDAMWRNGVEVMVNYRPVHLTRYFRGRTDCKEGMFPNAERIGSETFSLPFYPKITREAIGRVSATLEIAIDEATAGTT